MDVVGLDVVLDIENHYRELRPGLPRGTIEILEKMIAKNQLGLKTGSGFYEYKSSK
jgi:3-hydroxybutyryl-CoA dehydrogenase